MLLKALFLKFEQFLVAEFAFQLQRLSSGPI